MPQPSDDRLSTDTRVDLPYISIQLYDEVDSRPSRKKARVPLFVAAGLLVVLVVVGVAAASSKQFRRQAELSIVRQPTPYTQLYFAQPAVLPRVLKVDKRNIFDFTVVNNENRADSYTYTVRVGDSRSQLVVGTGTVAIANGKSATCAVTVVPKDRKSRYLISVVLQGMNQSIHFYARTS